MANDEESAVQYGDWLRARSGVKQGGFRSRNVSRTEEQS
jgi:hypothetical protein